MAALLGLPPVFGLKSTGVFGKRLLEVEFVREGAIGVLALLPVDVEAAKGSIDCCTRYILRQLAGEPAWPALQPKR